MRFAHNTVLSFCATLNVLFAVASAGQPSFAGGEADQARRQVIAYVAKLADLHCTETVVQEKLAASGHVQASERARYDYLVMIDGNADDFQLNESRVESSAGKHKPLPMMITNGFSTLLLIFHPYYRDSFIFKPGADEVVNGREVQVLHFSQVDGRRSPTALALRGREFPLELQGTAWLDLQSGQVEKIDAHLSHDMSDIGLRSLSIQVHYKPFNLGSASGTMTLPAEAVVDATTPRQHWRNTHTFDSYKSFSAAAEQDPNVRVHTGKAGTASGDTPEELQSNPREKQ